MGLRGEQQAERGVGVEAPQGLLQSWQPGHHQMHIFKAQPFPCNIKRVLCKSLLHTKQARRFGRLVHHAQQDVRFVSGK